MRISPSKPADCILQYLRLPFHLCYRSFMALKNEIRSSLARLARRNITSGFSLDAAVLIPIFQLNSEPHFLLTLRTEEVQTHKGQISFPGGMREGDENLEQTALRETFEEVGIGHGRIEILGRFHDYLSSTGYRVTPFAGFIEEPFTTTLQSREVAEVLMVPFRIFAEPGRLRVERRLHLGKLIDVFFFSYGTYEIWGLTARIIRDFLETIPG
jgi:8-oxo-dGTP pyrophosphatase MutT (NUDIX family)